MDSNEIPGIHHITALASDPQRNLDFYVGFMGLRLVKKTVNFDSPDVYHFYYGDEGGRPGTILTFFPFPDAMKGTRGIGQATAVAFSISPLSLDYWLDRLARQSIHFDGPARMFGEEFISFEDPDGMLIELVAGSPGTMPRVWEHSSVAPEHAVRGFYGVTLSEDDNERPAAFLSEVLGFQYASTSGDRRRFVAGSGMDEAKVDIVLSRDGKPGRMSAGSVHHIAWRTSDKQTQAAWRQRIANAGLDVTEIVDRQYFTSIYFHEPGGILFEIATDPPGFTVDESLSNLGTSLRLPPWLEPERTRLEQLLPPVVAPTPSARVRNAREAR